MNKFLKNFVVVNYPANKKFFSNPGKVLDFWNNALPSILSGKKKNIELEFSYSVRTENSVNHLTFRVVFEAHRSLDSRSTRKTSGEKKRSRVVHRAFLAIGLPKNSIGVYLFWWDDLMMSRKTGKILNFNSFLNLFRSSGFSRILSTIRS